MGKIIRDGNIITPTTYIEKKIKIPPYERPSDWLPIPQFDHNNKDEVYILNGVGLNCLNQVYFYLTVSQPATIDWGDGTVEQISTTTKKIYSHKYNYENIAESSYTKHNKTKQVLIHINTTRGGLSYINFGINYYYTNSDGVKVAYDRSSSTDIYEINADVQSCEVYCISEFNLYISHRKLEIFDWKGNITNNDMRHMFYNCTSLQSIPQLDTSKVTNMYKMFSDCRTLKSIPNLNTSKATSMTGMFNNCTSLQSIPQLDTSKVTNINEMFYGCEALQSIPNLNTSKATSMNSFFDKCTSLQSIPPLDTSNVTQMSRIFIGCSSLQSIPPLDTSKVKYMDYAFDDCYSLQNLILYNAGASNATTITISGLKYSKMPTKQALIDLFNSVAPNDVEGHTRTIQLGSTLQGYLSNQYVKDSGQLYTAILPTQDTTAQSGKTYYTYNDISGKYTEFTGSTFESGAFYYELKTATWNTYIKCESTDEGSMLALDYMTNIKKWTVL